MNNKFRAAYWTDGHAEVLLTGEEQAGLSDDDLMAAALNEADSVGLEIGEGRIEIGEFAAH